jgi:hypothetical protein
MIRDEKDLSSADEAAAKRSGLGIPFKQAILALDHAKAENC